MTEKDKKSILTFVATTIFDLFLFLFFLNKESNALNPDQKKKDYLKLKNDPLVTYSRCTQ